MVVGLEIFKQHFEPYTNSYILIGGSACAVQMEALEMEFRVTKDFDIILIVEALTPAFVRHFWDFIRAGKYEIAQVNNQKRFYRFIKPGVLEYPFMLELFARRPEALPPIEGLYITDIPTSEDLSSLSAILLDEDYYSFTLANGEIVNGLRLANNISLIALKAKAFLNNLRRREEGQIVRSDDIYKHRKDVLRLTAAVLGEPIMAVPEKIKIDIAQFTERALGDLGQINILLKSMQLGANNPDEIINRMRLVFGIVS